MMAQMSKIDQEEQIQYLIPEGVSESSNAELEGSEIRRFVETSHFFGHQSLVNTVPVGIRGINWNSGNV
jgi:hypothetical protein